MIIINEADLVSSFKKIKTQQQLDFLPPLSGLHPTVNGI